MKNDLYKNIYYVTEKIGADLGLHIDQLGELDAEIIDIVRGKNKSEDFIDHICKRLEVDRKKAMKIAEQVNENVFRVMRDNMKPDEDSSFSSLERAGGITIEKAPLESGAQVTSADRGQILAGLENPPSWSNNTPAAPTNLPVGNGPIASFGAQPTVENHTEPLVDYLLSNASAQKSETVSAAATSAPKPQTPKPAPQAPKGPDPYREEPK